MAINQKQTSLQIEGRNAVIEAMRAGKTLNAIYVKGEYNAALSRIIKIARSRGIPIKELDADAFQLMAKTSVHQGVIAVAAPKDYVEVDDIISYAEELGEEPFIIVLNELTDPQNLGGILRTAECLGVHGIIIPKHRACSVNETVVKVSAGAVAYIKVARVTNIAVTLERLKQKGLWVIGADMSGNSCFSVDLTGPIALVIGGEDKGLGKLVKEKCDMLVSIPMKGHLNSLNAAVAASILSYDILRQRMIKKDGETL
jgi:23S rRNA (guanosine2251-2'-O)-methyltransferase